MSQSNLPNAGENIERVAADLGLTMTAEFVPWSLSSNAKEDRPSLNWKITLLCKGRRVLETDYSAGSGHCPSYKQGDRSVRGELLCKWECEHGRQGAFMGEAIMNMNAKPIMPKLADVLHSLALDSDVLDSSGFEDWASDLGYDTDSRKAEAIYRACLEIALKLKSALGDEGLKTLREACQDY